MMDPVTRRNLEISETLRGERSPTLLSLLDTCVTGPGRRRLRERGRVGIHQQRAERALQRFLLRRRRIAPVTADRQTRHRAKIKIRQHFFLNHFIERALVLGAFDHAQHFIHGGFHQCIRRGLRARRRGCGGRRHGGHASAGELISWRACRRPVVLA